MTAITEGYRIVFNPGALRIARLRARLRLVDVQEATGINERSIRRYELGEQTPSARVLADLANSYGCSVLEFYPEAE